MEIFLSFALHNRLLFRATFLTLAPSHDWITSLINEATRTAGLELAAEIRLWLDNEATTDFPGISIQFNLINAYMWNDAGDASVLM